MRTDFASATGRIRRWRPSDAAELDRAVQESAADIRRGMGWLAIYGPDWIDRTAILWRERQAYNFAMLTAPPEGLAGSIWLSQINWLHGSANVGYWIRSSLAGRGLATAALHLIAGFGFDELHLHRLEILVATNNAGSLRVALKAGARQEGLLRQKLLLEGIRQDAILLSLLADEWKPGDPAAGTCTA